MRVRDFMRKRALIDRETGKRHARMMQHLIRDARAVPVMVENNLVGYLLPTGETVCAKKRFKTVAAALQSVQEINMLTGGTGKIPYRAYPCPYCKGIHLTSHYYGNKQHSADAR